MQTIRIQTSQNIELEYELAGLGPRIVAYLLDSVIQAAYVLILILFFSATYRGSEPSIPVVVILALPVLFYHLVSEVFMNGQSVGKKVMNIRVISLDGSQPGIGQYLIRWLLRFVDFSLFSGLVALLAVVLTEKAQRVGDILANTTLIRTTMRTTLQDTIFVETREAHPVKYPQVVQLSDANIALVKEVLNRHYRNNNFDLVFKTAEKLRNVLNIQLTNYDPEYFLNDVLRDYNYLTSQDR